MVSGMGWVKVGDRWVNSYFQYQPNGSSGRELWTVRVSPEDFAALELLGTQFMLHGDHAYNHHPYAARLSAPGPRGTGVELRVMGIDPDEAERRARASNATVLQPAKDFPHGWRDARLEDPDGYVWAVGIPIGDERRSFA